MYWSCSPTRGRCASILDRFILQTPHTSCSPLVLETASAVRIKLKQRTRCFTGFQSMVAAPAFHDSNSSSVFSGAGFSFSPSCLPPSRHLTALARGNNGVLCATFLQNPSWLWCQGEIEAGVLSAACRRWHGVRQREALRTRQLLKDTLVQHRRQQAGDLLQGACRGWHD